MANSPLNFVDPTGMEADETLIDGEFTPNELMSAWWQKEQTKNAAAGSGGGSLLDDYGNWANDLTGGMYGSIGNGMYGGASAIGVSDETMAKMKDWQLVVGTGVAATGIVLGGEWLLGVGTIGPAIGSAVGTAATSTITTMTGWWTSLTTSATGGISAGTAALAKAAAELYPKMAAFSPQWHHIWPKYLGMPPADYLPYLNRNLVQLPAAYHRMITVEMQKILPTGQVVLPQASEIYTKLMDIYTRFPIDGFPFK